MQKSEFCRFFVQNWILKKFLDRSVSFLRQQTHEHVKTIKKGCLEANTTFFRKSAFKKCFPGGFPPGGVATHRRVFCLDFLGMFRLFWCMFRLFFEILRLVVGMCRLFGECLDPFGNV